MDDARIPVLPVGEGYDRWAEVYDSDGNPLVALEELHFDALLGPVAGMRVLDIGCGTGRHALRLARAGARVSALDLSAGMLARARAAHARAGAGAGEVEFLLQDARGPLPFADASFERVVSGLVLEHVENLEVFFREVGRVLAPGGSAVISTIHPAMALRGVQARFYDPRDGSEIRVEGRPQPLGEVVMGVLRFGLELEHLSEHAPDAELAARFPRAEKYVGWPLVLLLRVRRQA